MTTRFIGIDLGSSFIKGAVLDLDALAIRHIERLPFPEPIRGLDPAFREFNPAEIVAVTRSLLDRLLRDEPAAAGVVMCSQLHGMVITTDDGQAVSNAINWQDQRALQPFPGGHGSYFDKVNRRLTPEERRQLGNEARPGVPLCYLFWLAENHLLPAESVTATALPNFVVANLCGCPSKSDVTNAFAHGALNVGTLDWHGPVIEKFGLDRVRWPEIIPQGAVGGEYRMGSRTLPVFAPVGDYHCSQAGAFLDEGELSVNISTGSAVIQLARACEFGDFQTRPWFDGRFLKTITHIPGGRALNALVRLLSELAEAQGLKLRDPWDCILAEAAKIGSTDLRVDPAFYFSAMGDRGALTNVREKNLRVGHLFHAAFAGMADNYAQCAARLSPGKDWTRLVFSGGVALKAALLCRLICDRLGQAHRLAASEEDTLLGLLVLSLAFSGRFPSVADAIAFARKHYGHLRKLGEKFGIAEKEVEESEYDVCDASNENLPGGADVRIF
jgi:sugar (pentulose or hexulose) kinase